jgi:hypothetical protein
MNTPVIRKLEGHFSFHALLVDTWGVFCVASQSAPRRIECHLPMVLLSSVTHLCFVLSRSPLWVLGMKLFKVNFLVSSLIFWETRPHFPSFPFSSDSSYTPPKTSCSDANILA